MDDRRDSAWDRLSLSTRLNLITASILLGTMGAFVSLDYARERDSLLRAHAEEIAIIAALTARELSMADVEGAALRIHKVTALSRSAVERLDDVFLAKLKVPTESEPRGSTERASSDDRLAVEWCER